MMEPAEKISQGVKRSGKKTLLVLVLISVCLLGIAFYANAWKDQRRVERIIVEGNTIVSDQEVLALAKIPTGELMFELDLYAIGQRVLKQPYVKSVAIHRDLPDRVRISVEERKPVGVIPRGNLLYIDADGVVLPSVRSDALFDLPVLAVSMPEKECVPGRQTSNTQVLEALRILALAREVDEEMYRNISEIDVDGPGGIVFYTAEHGIPVFVGRERIGVKLVMFSQFWKTIVARKGANRLEYIDLRFDDQVVVRWNHRTTDVHS